MGSPSLRTLAHAVTEARKAERITLRESGRTYFVAARDVVWIEAKRNYALVHLRDRTVAVRETLASVEERLPRTTFARIHRSAIVNVDCIRYVEPWFRGEVVAVLDDGTRLTSSRAHGSNLDRFLTAD
jgi:two-component system LytT family response regulator